MATLGKNLFAVFLVLSLAGCISYAESEIVEEMISTPQLDVQPNDVSLIRSIYIEEIEGVDAGVGKANGYSLDIQSFREAFLGSFKSRNLQSQNKELANYVLTVHLIGVKEPVEGVPFYSLDVPVTVYVDYKLLKNKSNRPYFVSRISSTHTAGLGSGYILYTRIQIARQGAVKKNFQMFFDQLFNKKGL